MVIQQMHYEFKLRFNKLNTNHNKDLVPAMIDNFINHAIDIFLETIAYGGNSQKPVKFGFESTMQRTDMLSSIVVGQPEQVPITSYNYNEIQSFSQFDLDTLEYKYRHITRAYFFDSCKNKINVDIESHNDIDRILDDYLKKPSITWRRSSGLLKSDTLVLRPPNRRILEIYYPERVNAVNINYIKEPKKVFFGGYNGIETVFSVTGGYTATDPAVNSDLPEGYHSTIVDIAVAEASRSKENYNKNQSFTEKVLINN